MTKQRLHFEEPLRSIALSILSGGLMPSLFWNLFMWTEAPYLRDAQFYLPFTLTGFPTCLGFSITGFPAIVFFFVLAWLLGQTQKSLGYIPIIDALGPRAGTDLVFALSLLFNICVHWVVWRWFWRGKPRSEWLGSSDTPTTPS